MNDNMKKSILVIDDDPMILDSIKRQLKKEEYINVDLENNPVLGLEKIEKSSYDLIICDMIMKPITGSDVLLKVKSDYPDIPVIILTGFVDDKMMEQVKNIGCDDFLIKPIRKKVLIESVRNLLKII